jgi:hypothetical protein
MYDLKGGREGFASTLIFDSVWLSMTEAKIRPRCSSERVHYFAASVLAGDADRFSFW